MRTFDNTVTSFWEMVAVFVGFYVDEAVSSRL